MKNSLIIITCLIGMLGMAQQSYSLQQAVEYTLANNYEILKADLEIEKAERRVWETTATGLPHIDGSVDYNYNIDIPVAVFQGQVIPLGSKQTLAANLQATQLIFNGSYIVGLQSAKAYKEISNMAKEKTEAELIEAVVNAYAAVIIADENLEILNKNVSSSQKNLNDLREIYKAGFTEEQSVDQINYTLTQLKTSRNYAERQKESALNSLKFLMGLEQEQTVALTTTLEELMADNLNPLNETLVGDVSEHIDYKIANHQVLTSELQVKYQKSMALPSLNTFFQHSQNNFSADGAIFSGFDEWNPTTIWGLKLDIPIFSSFERRARTQQAMIDLEEAEIEKTKVEQQIMLDIKNAEVAYENALENYYSSQDLVELSDKIYDKEQIKFTEGISSSMDLTNAEEQLYRAQNQYIQSAFDVIQSKSALYQALGKY